MATIGLARATRAEAEEYFHSWVGRGDDILARFRRQVAAASGPVEALEAGVEGLEPLFAWVVEQVRFVGVVPDDDLPLWYLPGPANHEDGELDPASARLVDGLCRHYGEVLVRRLPGVRWEIGDEPRRRRQYVDQHWPLVVGPDLAVNPVRAAALVVREARSAPDARRVDYLRSNAERYRDILARGGPIDESSATWVDEVDDEVVRQDGWRWEVGLAEDLAALDADLLSTLTSTLTAVPGIARVEHADRDAFLVAGDPSPDDLREAVRGWAARH